MLTVDTLERCQHLNLFINYEIEYKVEFLFLILVLLDRIIFLMVVFGGSYYLCVVCNKGKSPYNYAICKVFLPMF